MTVLIDAFFYGLYMDESVLAGVGVAARNGREARADGVALKIGRRATLVKKPGSAAWGMVFALTQAELDALYGAPGLEVYRPEEIEVALLDGTKVTARVYNLAQPPAAGERNPDYAARLKDVLTELGFPAAYIAGIE
jgi:hypothetical protein